MVPKWWAEVQCGWDYDTILRKPFFQTVYSWKANLLWLQGTTLQYFNIYNIYSWTMDVVFKDDVTLVGWKDSKAVYCPSKKFKGPSQSSCSRCNHAEHKYVDIQIPECIQACNQGMWGVDIMDKMVAGYRPKWWLPIYAWSISSCSCTSLEIKM